MAKDFPSPKTVADFPEPQVLNRSEAWDIDALEWLMPKESKLHKFDKETDAIMFVYKCMAEAPKQLGAEVPTNMPESLIKPFLKGAGILVLPKKNFPHKEDYWRRGWYIYKDNELKFFVSVVLEFMGKIQQGGKIVIKGEPEYHVRTNVKV